MPLHAVSAHIGAIRFGASGAPGELSVNLRMAREVDEHAREASSVEIHRDRISIPDFLDPGAVGQHMEAGKSEDLEPSVDPIGVPCRRSRDPRGKKECNCSRRQGSKTGQDHDPNHLTDGNGQSRVGGSCFRPELTVFGQCGNPAARKPSAYLATSCGRWYGPNSSSRLEIRSLGSSFCSRSSTFLASSRRPASALLAAAMRSAVW